MSEEDIQKAVKEAEKYAKEDQELRELTEAINNADSTVYAAEQSLKDMEGKITEDEKADVEKKIEEVKEAINDRDKDKIQKKMEELNEKLYPLAQKMYQETEKTAPLDQEEAAQAGDDDVVEAEVEDITDED